MSSKTLCLSDDLYVHITVPLRVPYILSRRTTTPIMNGAWNCFAPAALWSFI